MEYGKFNNLISIVTGVSIIMICCVISYISQKKIFDRKKN